MVPNDVVQFNENHKWCGCFGFIREIKGDRIMVGVPMPQQGTAFIYCSPDDVEFIGSAVLVTKDEMLRYSTGLQISGRNHKGERGRIWK